MRAMEWTPPNARGESVVIGRTRLGLAYARLVVHYRQFGEIQATALGLTRRAAIRRLNRRVGGPM